MTIKKAQKILKNKYTEDEIELIIKYMEQLIEIELSFDHSKSSGS